MIKRKTSFSGVEKTSEKKHKEEDLALDDAFFKGMALIIAGGIGASLGTLIGGTPHFLGSLILFTRGVKKRNEYLMVFGLGGMLSNGYQSPKPKENSKSFEDKLFLPKDSSNVK